MIFGEALDLFETVLEYRRHLHSQAELSFEERLTGDYIAQVLEREGIRFSRIADTGVLARIDGYTSSKRTVVLRADIDALPVTEQTGLPFASTHEGVMHACGHDMHAAALLGALLLLRNHRDLFQGTIFGLFQPGEEVNPGGASLVLQEEPFADFDVVAVIGEHVEPDLPTGSVGFRAGKYMASSDEVRIAVRGQGGHAALPHRLKDPVVAAAAMITSFQQIVGRNADPRVPTVFSIGRVIADGATNVIPDKVEMEGTLRTFEERWRTDARERIRAVADGVARAYGVEADVNISEGYPCVVNDTALVALGRTVCMELLGRESVVKLGLRPTAEDFGYYTQRYPSLFFRLGVGYADGHSAGRLHTSAFNPDEKALCYGMAILAALAMRILELPKQDIAESSASRSE